MLDNEDMKNMSESLIKKTKEDIARAIYESWKDQTGYTPWVPRGNSNKQEEARDQAEVVIKAIAPTLDVLSSGFAALLEMIEAVSEEKIKAGDEPTKVRILNMYKCWNTVSGETRLPAHMIQTC